MSKFPLLPSFTVISSPCSIRRISDELLVQLFYVECYVITGSWSPQSLFVLEESFHLGLFSLKCNYLLSKHTRNKLHNQVTCKVEAKAQEGDFVNLSINPSYLLSNCKVLRLSILLPIFLPVSKIKKGVLFSGTCTWKKKGERQKKPDVCFNGQLFPKFII